MILSIDQVLDKIKECRSEKKTRIIAIDGHGGSGKSRLAKELALRDSDIFIIHFDDFYNCNLNCDKLPQFDFQRLESQVLKFLADDKNTKFQCFDWVIGKLNDWIEVTAGKIIIVEGVYSLNINLLKYYCYKIWVDCSLDIRLDRAKVRDKEFNINTMDLWLNDWIPRENNYVNAQKPYNSANLIIDGSGINADIEIGKVNVLESIN